MWKGKEECTDYGKDGACWAGSPGKPEDLTGLLDLTKTGSALRRENHFLKEATKTAWKDLPAARSLQ